ncbi:MAG: hypothetical protein Q9181_001665 [Wetmoreana brouardii]
MLVKTAQKRKLKQVSSNIVVTETAQEFDILQAQQQSFETVHALLHSSDAKAKYQDRADIPSPGKRRKAPTETDNPSSSSQNLKVLVPNSSPGVNIFLGWLDGILHGVLKGTITAAQFCICPDQKDRAKVIESYTFRFHYGASYDGGGRRVTGIAVSGLARNPKSIKGVRDGLHQLMKLIASYTEKMPDLPGMSMLSGKAQ